MFDVGSFSAPVQRELHIAANQVSVCQEPVRRTIGIPDTGQGMLCSAT